MALPASEQKWADDNGGVVRVEGPDANGSTTYHTATGQYIVIRANGTPAMRRPPPQRREEQA